MTPFTSSEDGSSLAHPVKRIPNPINAAAYFFQNSFDNIFDLQKKFLIDVDQDNRFLPEVDFKAVTLSNNMYQSSGTNGSSFFFWKNKVEYSFGFLPPGSMIRTSD